MIDSLHDTHFHLDLYDNVSNIVKEIEKRKSYTVAVTNLPILYDKLNNRINSKYVRVALGFHPELILEYSKYIPLMWSLLEESRYIGEVGLDLKNKSVSDRNAQTAFFKELISRCNNLGGKILSIHSRYSEKEVLSFTDNFNGTIIYHWFSGSLTNLDKAISSDGFFSINYAMLNSIKGKKIIDMIPNDRILLESDGPFVKINRKLFQPNDLSIILEKLAYHKSLHLTEMRKIISQNFKNILLR